MKICFLMIVFNGDAVLREALEPLLSLGPVVVAEGPVAYYGKQGWATSTDCTNEILREMLPADRVVHGRWFEKDDQMNATKSLIPEDTTHVWMVDSDEVWKPRDLEAVLGELDSWDSVSFKPITFFGGFDRVLTGFEQRFVWYRVQRWYPGAQWLAHRPPTVLSPEGRPWRDYRH